LTVSTTPTPWLTTGRALKVERVMAGLTITQVAAAMGVSVSHISHIEAGRRYANAATLDRIRATMRELAA